MSALPSLNPIDLGYVHRGAPIDFIGRTEIECVICDSRQMAFTYKMIMTKHLGFGAPVFVKPFLKTSSTRGKIGKKGLFSICSNCTCLEAQDLNAIEIMASLGYEHTVTASDITEARMLEVVDQLIPSTSADADEELDVHETAEEPPLESSTSRVSKLESNTLTNSQQSAAEDNAKIRELRKQLAEAEAEAAEQHQATRRLEELEKKIAEKKSRVTKLTEEIQRHEADLADLKRPSNSPSLEEPDWSSWSQGKPAQSKEERQKEARARRTAERKREVDRQRRLQNPSKPSSLEEPDWTSWSQGEPAQSEEQHESSQPFECGYCGAAVVADSDFCESCGTSFDSDTVECAYCDAEVPSNANFCPSCGAEFES